MSSFRITVVLAIAIVGCMVVPAAAKAPPRLDGKFKVTGTVLKTQPFFGDKKGDKLKRDWTFVPNCGSGACMKTTVKRTTGPGNPIRTTKLVRHGSVYKGTASFAAKANKDSGGTCPITFTQEIKIHVTGSSEDMATKFAGKLHSTVTSKKCPGPFPFKETLGYTGTRK